MVSHQAADELTRLSDSMGDRWKEARLITKSEDLEFTTSPRGTMAQVVHPGWDTSTSTWAASYASCLRASRAASTSTTSRRSSMCWRASGTP